MTEVEQYLEGLEAERIRNAEFWESSRMWFREQGYFLYEQVDKDDSKYEYAKPTIGYPDTPPVSFESKVEDPFPYAFMGPGRHEYLDRPPYGTWKRIVGPVIFAQDVKGRHLAIKKVTNEEYKVLRLLKEQSRLKDPNAFPSVIPILDLLQREDQWFAVMPRWTSNINHTTFFPTFHLAIRYLISLLEGLAFLHELRIFNRDICVRNILVNHISSTAEVIVSQSRYHQHLKSIGALRYAIMDFDLAMILDEKTYGLNPRLPIGLVKSVFMSMPPYETMHGHVDFDPFKYDVACLGIHLSDQFQQIIPDVPLLAPLLDRMLTSNIDARFTAAQALAFARSILSTVSPLDAFEREPQIGVYYHLADRWQGLPASFIEEWGSYCENQYSFTKLLQNWLYSKRGDYPSAWYLMYYSRYIAHTVCVPRSIMRHFPPWFIAFLGWFALHLGTGTPSI